MRAAFLRNRAVYLHYLLALVRPGHPPPALNTDQTVVEDVTARGSDDLDLIIEEGRRNLDRLLADLERIRGRAQYAFTLGLALLVGTAAQLAVSPDEVSDGRAVLAVAGVITLLGLLGVLALMIVQVNFAATHAGVLTRKPPPLRPALAKEYAENVIYTGRTTSTMLTVYREAVLYISVGAATNALYWLMYRL